MPPCRLALRSLPLDSRSLARFSIAAPRRLQWQPAPRSYGTAVAAQSQDDGRIGNSIKPLAKRPDGGSDGRNVGAQVGLNAETKDESAQAVSTMDNPAFYRWASSRPGHKEGGVGHAKKLPAAEGESPPSQRPMISGETRLVENAVAAKQPIVLEEAQASALVHGHTKRVRRVASQPSSRLSVPYEDRAMMKLELGLFRRRTLFRRLVPRRNQRTLRRKHQSYWHREISRLDGRYDKNLPQIYLRDPGPPRMPSGYRPIISAVRDRLTSLRSRIRHVPRETTDVLDLLPMKPRMARACWNMVALWFLYHKPEQAIDLLAATVTRPYLSSKSVSGAIRYLVVHFRHHQDQAQKDRCLSRLANIVLSFAEHNPKVHLRFVHGSTIRHLIPRWTSNQLNSVWAAVVEKRIDVAWPTVLHFARRFIDDGDFEKGFDAIKEARRLGVTFGSYALSSSCSYLLRSAGRQTSGLRVTLRLVEDLAELGVTLNLQMCNIVILNAVEGGDPKTAFALYRSLVQNGLQADQYTYGILLKACRSIDDADLLNETIRSAIAHVNIQQNERLATEILHCLALFHTKKDPSNAFTILSEAYAQLFDGNPLRMLGVPRQQTSSEGRTPPTHQAIGIMLSVYLDHVDQQNKTCHVTFQIYDRYRKFVVAGAEPFASMISEDYIPNLFLHSLIRTQQGLLPASQVIKDMQRPTDASRPVKQCPPTVQTWSIFLHGFTRHGKLELAEQVLTYMRSKGMEPDVATWNTMVKGYATAQDLSGLLGSLDRLEDGGLSWTPQTVAGTKWYRQQADLQEALRQKEQKAVELNFVTDLKAQLLQKFELAGKDSEVKETEKAEERTNAPYKPFVP